MLTVASQPDPAKPGIYQLLWAVPDNTKAYWSKCSTKQIVPWLFVGYSNLILRHIQHSLRRRISLIFVGVVCSVGDTQSVLVLPAITIGVACEDRGVAAAVSFCGAAGEAL